MGNTLSDWTWEACMYNTNKEILDKMIKVRSGAKYLFHKEDYGAVLGKMLNNKVDVAYQILISGQKFEMPNYVKDAIEWVNK